MEARDAGAEAVGSLGKQGGVAMVTGRANQWQRYSLAASRTRHPGEGGGGSKIHRCDPGGQEGTRLAKQVERCIFLGAQMILREMRKPPKSKLKKCTKHTTQFQTHGRVTMCGKQAFGFDATFSSDRVDTQDARRAKKER